MTCKISAVIPAYNAERFLTGAVESIRKQTVGIDEIIVVDDGSLDGTGLVAKSLGSDVIYYRQDNAGPARARNVGISLARGDFIAFLDADDRWTENKTVDQFAAFERYPELALVASDMREVDEGGKVLTPSVLAKHGQLSTFQTLSGAPVPCVLSLLLKKNFIPTGTVMARRAVLNVCGGFKPDIRYGEDLEFWARIASRQPIACLPEVHLLRTQHAANTTKSTEPMLEDLVKVMRIIDEECGTIAHAQGANTQQAFAVALADLGYWRFVHGDYPAARRTMAASLSASFNLRALAYSLAANLPASLIRNLRSLKQRLYD